MLHTLHSLTFSGGWQSNGFLAKPWILAAESRRHELPRRCASYARLVVESVYSVFGQAWCQCQCHRTALPGVLLLSVRLHVFIVKFFVLWNLSVEHDCDAAALVWEAGVAVAPYSYSLKRSHPSQTWLQTRGFAV